MSWSANILCATPFSSDANSYAFALSSTPASDQLILFSYTCGAAGVGNVPSVSGCGLTWVEVDSTTMSTRRVAIYRAMGTVTSSGPVVISHGSSSQTRAIGHIQQFFGADTGGTNGSGAIVQANANQMTAVTSSNPGVTLSAFASTANATYFNAALITLVSTNNSYTFSSDYTVLGSEATNAPVHNQFTMYRDGDDTFPNIVTTALTIWGAVAAEIKLSTGGAAATFIRAPQLSLLGVS